MGLDRFIRLSSKISNWSHRIKKLDIILMVLMSLICCNVTILCAQESPSVSVEGDSDISASPSSNSSTTLDQDDETINSLANSLITLEQPASTQHYNLTRNTTNQTKYQNIMLDSNYNPECSVTLIFFRKVEIGNSEQMSSLQKNTNLKNLIIKKQNSFLSQFLGSGLHIVYPSNNPILNCHIKNPMTINDQFMFVTIEKFIRKYLFSLN